jgi:sugar diacid utilization regulator
MSAGPLPPVGEAEVDLRDQFSSMQGLLVLSMLMTEAGDEQRILQLASTAVPSLDASRLHGVYVLGEGWRPPQRRSAHEQLDAELEAQLAVLSSAGGPVAIVGDDWGWAYPLRSLEGHFGFMLIGRPAAPSPGTQFLLRVLAQQTGIAVANARLHARERAKTAELRTANAALASTVGALERSTAVHDRLTSTAASGEGLDGIATALHELTGYAVVIEDRTGNLIASAGTPPADPYPLMGFEARERWLAQVRTGEHAVHSGGRLVAIASPRDDVVGVLALVDPDGSAAEDDRTALEHGATVLAMELARLQSVADTELRLGRDLVDQLLAGTASTQVLEHARGLGFDVARPHRVFAMTAADLDRRHVELLQVVRRAAVSVDAPALVVARGPTVLLLVDTAVDEDGLVGAVARYMGGEICRIGVGGACRSVADFPRSQREAEVALRMLHIAGRQAGVSHYDDLGVYRLLAEVQDPDSIEQFVRHWLGPLLDYDAERHTELVTTLSRYLEMGGSYDATADAVAVHRSTLKYRLQRIRDISGVDISDPGARFNLELATRALATLRAVREPGAEGG